jgi:hypothetical protein
LPILAPELNFFCSAEKAGAALTINTALNAGTIINLKALIALLLQVSALGPV